MSAVEACTSLQTLEPLGDAWHKVVCGELLELDLREIRDAGLAVACVKLYLGRSGSCLTSMDLRFSIPFNNLTSLIFISKQYYFISILWNTLIGFSINVR